MANNLDNIHSKFHRDWIPILSDVVDEIAIAMGRVLGTNHTPDVCNILEAFRISPNIVKVVIIGQDPYPTKGHADGLSFSTKARDTPKSLENIFKAITYSMGYDNAIMSSRDLHIWLYQGVLLLNVTFTTLIGSPKQHCDIWHGITGKIVDKLSKVKTNITFMLWGNDAISLSKHICSKNGHHILQYTHPSPMADNRLLPAMKFERCTHFKQAYDRYGIMFVTSPVIRIYTDGSISTVDQECSYAVIFSLPTIGTISGKVCHNEYIYDDEKCIFTCDSNIGKIPTSQRAEYLAMCYALYSVIKLSLTDCYIEIYSDSLNCVKTMNEWYDNRKSKGTTHKFENIDLVEPIMCMKRHIPKLTVTHIESHKSLDVEDADLKYHRTMNDKADKLAKLSLQYDNYLPLCSSTDIMIGI